ncbi:hypothetical protein [Ramlibacter sp. AN1133]|uniref:hypothetical protein n=1 Tax=Ramlibacter sp. AN1133 TaxID=3133429 RepID=UPI0030C214FF
MQAFAVDYLETGTDAQQQLAELQAQHLLQLEAAITLAPGRAVPMHSFLAGLCMVHDCSFTLRGAELAAEHVMAPEMFLPMVAGTAMDDGRYLAGIDLGCGLRVDDGSLFGVRSVVPHLTGHIADVMRALFFMHAARKVFGLRERACIDLTASYEVMNGQFQSLRQALGSQQGEIPWPLPQRLS